MMEQLISAVQDRLKKIDTLIDVNSFRLFHGRGKCFPGLEGCCIDIYYPVILVTAFDDYPESFKNDLATFLTRSLSPLGGSVVLYQYRRRNGVDNTVLSGNVPDSFYARRNNLKFALSFSQQNVGFFLDIEPGRAWLETTIKRSSAPVRVLNLFSYTCAFSVVATHAGADSVVNIDLSSRSLKTGRENYQLNNLSAENVSFFPHDIFKSWGKLKRLGPYDIVIIDPPSAQKGSFLEDKDYRRVWSRMADLVADGGKILTCLNAPNVKRSEFKDRAVEALPDFSFERWLDRSSDFPEHDEECGLKLAVFEKKQGL